MKEITEQMLDQLREEMRNRLSPKRFHHTAEVERAVARLCALYAPQSTLPMRAAALLHDLTKELSPGEQETLCQSLGLRVTAQDRLSPKTFHARTAAALIPRQFPAFSDPTVISAVRWHTTGHRGMTLTEQLLYLADYIDDSRTFPACVLLRNTFFDARPECMSAKERREHLRDVLLLSFDLTVRDLLTEGQPIAPDTVCARNELLQKKSQ